MNKLLPPGIKLESDGTYTVDTIKIVNSKRIHIYGSKYNSLEDAINAKERLIEYRLNNIKNNPNREISIKEFINKYIEYRSNHVRYTTMVFSKFIIKNYLVMDYHTSLKEVLSYDNIDRIYNELLDKDSTKMWKNRAFGILRSIISQAYKWNLYNLEEYHNVISIVENIKEDRKQFDEKDIWTDEEIKLFFSSIDNLYDRTLFSLAFNLGPRISELDALTWDCVDLDNSYVEIKQQMVNLGNHKDELTYNLKTPTSYRRCKITDYTCSLLRKHKELNTTGIGYVFPSQLYIGSPIGKTTIRTKLNYYIKKAGIKKVTMHAFRHLKATSFMKVCLNMDELKAAARYLGHSVNMLMETYAHTSNKTVETVLERLSDKENLIK